MTVHYSAVSDDGQENLPCLNYQPGKFTKLPNRYYSFRYGGVDFFALDSNTWKTAPESDGFDFEQLDWLERALVRSWESPEVTHRIVYLHHSPYTTEVSRWQRSETLWVRQNLRGTLARVKGRLGQPQKALKEKPLVDLVVSGHAHCLEHLKTKGSGQADDYIDWLVCGGSGVDIRPQWKADTADILETLVCEGRRYPEIVAESILYAGIQNRSRQQFHSFVRIEVQPDRAQSLRVVPFVVSSKMNTEIGVETGSSGKGLQAQQLRPIDIGRKAKTKSLV